jgi:hypothetical protein
MKFVRTTAALAALCSACGQSFSGATQPAQIETTGVYAHRGSGFSFPEGVGEFSRVAVTQYNADATDISVGYNLDRPGRQVAVTVYVYPAPPVEGESAQERSCSEQFDSIKSDVEHAHSGARLIAQTAAASPDPGYDKAGKKAVYEFEGVFAGKEQPLRSDAELYCYVAGSWFVAYRTTAPRGIDYVPELQRLMRQLRWPPKH